MPDTIERLRALYPPTKKRSILKQLDHLDPHCIRFIGLSPFLVIATSGADGGMDASPRGGAPGFVQVKDRTTLLMPDSIGNNRLDSYTNIVETGRVGLLFFIPGMDETLRVNGRARLCDDPSVLARFASERHPPRVVVEIGVVEAYLHCAKALMRSKLWDPEVRVERSVMPSMGQMIKEQSGSTDPVESQEAALERWKSEL